MRFALFLLVPLTLAGATPDLRKADLFTAGQGGYTTYRIPGIVVTAKGSVLAYAEARASMRGDWGPIDILLRRSTDNGRTFSPPRIIAKVPGPHRKNPVALLQNLANPTDVTYNNPVAIADRSGAVHFLFCLEYMRLFYMRSDDDGVTFSAPQEITATLDQFRPEYAWKAGAVGPGHGIQLSTGRLLVPVWLSLGTGNHAHRPSVVASIYSDDGGKSWRRGAIAVPDTPETVFPSETAAVELPRGRVLFNVRSESPTHRRLQTISPDGIAQWSPARFVADLLEPICLGSMIRLPDAAGQTRIIFSNPANLARADAQEAPGRNRDRRNLTIHLSTDEGQTWKISRPLEPGLSGYSDLAVTPSGDIFCLYERGRDAAKVQSAYLTLARFNIDWLNAPR